MRLPQISRWLLPLLLASAAIPALAQQAVPTNRTTDLRSRPEDASTLIRSLPEGTMVQPINERSGPWKRAKVGQDNGWVRMMHLRGGSTVVEAETSSGGGFFAAFNRLLGGSGERSNTQARSATVGIRGFSKEDVEKASANNSDFEKLKRYQTSGSDADRFANQNRLSSRSVAYLAQDAIANVNSAKGATR